MPALIFEILMTKIYSVLAIVALFVLIFLLFEKFRVSASPLGRFQYNLSILLYAFLSQVIAIAFVALAQYNFELSLFLWALSFLALTTFLVYVSRRRSVDAFEDTKSAFYAVIPIAFLWLMLRGPRGQRRLEKISVIKKLGYSFGFIVMALVTFGSVAFLYEMSERRLVNASYKFSVLPVESAVRIVAIAMDSMAPTMIDDQTFLLSVTSDERNLLMNYLISGAVAEMEPAAFIGAMTPSLIDHSCSYPQLRELLEDGATLIYRYTLQSSTEVINVDNVDCR